LNNQSKPKRNDRLLLKTANDETELIEPTTSRTYILNITATYVWKLCNGENTMHDILNRVAKRFGDGNENVERDIFRFIEKLVSLGYVAIEEPKTQIR
jgi:hypothetical protein